VKLQLQDERVDPKAFGEVLVDEVKAGFSFFRDVEEAVRGAGSILVVTEWDRYAGIDWAKLAGQANPGAVIFDGRKVIDQDKAATAGIKVFAVGQG
jgi:UDP-glucose 6-dehydrogenase